LHGAAKIAGDLWAVGVDNNRSQTGLLLRHSDLPCPAPTPTPKPTPNPMLSPPMPLPGTGAHTFPETGKTVSGVFLDYWQTHGGLMQQGYPISDEFSEVRPANRLTYTVQYFERAVFEYHSENAPPYDVLLSLLGRFQY